MTITHEIKEGLHVEFTGNPRTENDGIGSFEFWGSRETDNGQNYTICDDIDWDKSKHSDQENQIIDEYLNTDYDTIERKFIDEYEKD
jgi:hypothetical protein